MTAPMGGGTTGRGPMKHMHGTKGNAPRRGSQNKSCNKEVPPKPGKGVTSTRHNPTDLPGASSYMKHRG